MKKNILIPTDFSPNSINAIRYAVDLFKSKEVDFHIIHTYYMAGYSTENLLIPEPGDDEYERVRSNSEKNIEKLKQQIKLRDKNAGHTLHFSSEFGPLLEVLKKKAKKDNADLIIMGTRGEGDSDSKAFGSNAVSVMEKVRKCPVLAIPETVIFKKPNEIVFPTSFRTNCKENDLECLAEIAEASEAPIRILHIGKNEDLSEKQLKKKEFLESVFAHIPFTFHNLYNVAVETGVRCFVQSRESDMIAFINKKHFFFGSVFTNPMVKQLGKFANVPLLALHELES